MKKNFLFFVLFICGMLGIVSAYTSGVSCLQYGNAYEVGGYCKCMAGYVMQKNPIGNYYCVSANLVCANKYGVMSIYNILTNSCQCMAGYVLYDGQCLSKDSACKKEYGFGAESGIISDTCKCIYGYMWGVNILGDKQCINGTTYCNETFGYNAEFDYASNSCKCKEGYIVKNNACEKKENNVYFLVLDVNSISNEAIIYDSVNKKSYYIKYGLGCTNFGNYIGSDIVVNLGTDYYLNTFDKIILQNNGQSCDIISEMFVEDNYKINCPDMINGNLNHGVCYCNNGYFFDYTYNKCEKYTEDKKNDKLANNILFSIQQRLNLYSEIQKKIIYKSLLEKLNLYKTKYSGDDLDMINKLIILIKNELLK